MPEIILEENEGDSVIDRRAAMAAARAALNNGNGDGNNNDDDNNNEGAEGEAARPAEENRSVQEGSMTAAFIASQTERLIGVNARNLFQRLGVTSANDMKFMRERDLESIPHISPIHRRKLWGILKFVATDNRLGTDTTLADIIKVLNENKKNKDSPTNNSSSAAQQKQALQTSNTALMPIFQMVHSSKVDSFDGTYQKWICWKNKTQYSLSQTVLGPLLREGEGETVAKKWPGKDHLLFNILAEAIVGGSAKHLIAKAQSQSTPLGVAADSKSKSASKGRPVGSGRILWLLLIKEYTQGHMAFWILSDARQTLQKLCLSSPNDENDKADIFQTNSTFDYVQAFRQAKDTLEEFQQALPDQFLASTFVEHIQDARLDDVKKQLLTDITSKDKPLESCMSDLLMADHMRRTRECAPSPGNRKRAREDQLSHLEHQEDRKRLKADSAESDPGCGKD